MSRKQLVGFGLGLGSFLVLITMDPPSNMNPLAMKAAAVSVMMAVFWVTEAISIFATSFLPVVFSSF